MSFYEGEPDFTILYAAPIVVMLLVVAGLTFLNYGFIGLYLFWVQIIYVVTLFVWVDSWSKKSE